MALRPFSKIKLVYISSKINRSLSFTVIYKTEKKYEFYGKQQHKQKRHIGNFASLK